MTLSWNERPLDGCLFETSPVAAAELGAVPNLELPALVDLRAHCSPVEDQRKTNSCTANAIVGALEYHQRRAGLGATDLSRMFVYYNARKLADTESRDVGSFIHHVMAAVLAHGACEERMWPFEESMCTTEPTRAAYANARHYQAVQYARAPLGRSALQAVAAGLPVVFGTYIPQSFYGEAARGGVMPRPTERRERPGGGHAMLIVGYDMQRGEWLVRNSWGPSWADSGYVRIPFETLKAYSDPTHYWTIGAIEQTVGLTLSPAASAPVGEAFGAAGDSAQAGSVGADAPDVTGRLAGLRSDLKGSIGADLDAKRAGIRDRLRSPR